jgi:DUF4097 and DUF4098 domain-containing protein YvlB
MKTTLLIGLILCVMQLSAQTHSEKISKEISFEKAGTNNALIIANISGDISVEAYAGDKIIVEVTKTIKAKTQARLDKGKQELQLGLIDRADTLILYVDGLCSSFSYNKKGNSSGNKGWGYQWQNCDKDCRENYDWTMDFNLKVPANVNLIVSTVNDGDISIVNSKGSVVANNVNGSIKLNKLVREAEAHTINGNVDVEYDTNPKQDCRFYTLNGDINAWFQKGLAANMSFESFNGSFYTNIDKLEPLPVTVEKKSSGKGMKYKVNGNQYKVGNGGAHLDFETFNGNVYLKEKE